MMLFTTPTQFAVLALLLVIGWLFGFASHSGGKRWRKAYQDEAVGRAQDRDELDQQLRQGDGRLRALEGEKVALEARNAELAAELVRARTAAPAPPAPVVAQPAYIPPAPAPTGQPADVPPTPASTAQPAYIPPAPVTEHAPPAAAEPVAEAQPLPIKRGWFDWSRGDDLTRLRGVDDDLAQRLKAEKVESFAELAGLSDEDEVALERRLDLPAGYLMKEQLRDQARLLTSGQTNEHAFRFGDPAVS